MLSHAIFHRGGGGGAGVCVQMSGGAYVRTPRHILTMFIGTRNCFQYPFEGLSETSNNQALLIPFYHNIKM